MPNRVALIGDLLLVAEAQLGIPAEQLMSATAIDSDPSLCALLAGLEEPDPPATIVEIAALCGAWVVSNRPFPRENSEIGYRYMRLMLQEAEVPWPRPEEDAGRIERMLRLLEAESISEARFAEWVCLRVATA